MTHKLVSLLELRQKLGKLDDDGVVEFVQSLLKQNRRSTVIGGIFRQLYAEGESNSHIFLNDISRLCDEITSKHEGDKQMSNVEARDIDTNCKANRFSSLPDSLLSHIGSYLPVKCILISWTCVCRKFVQVGLKSETVTQWNMTLQSGDRIKRFPPKFPLDSILTKLKSLKYNSNFSRLFDVSKIKSLKNVEIGMYGD